MDGGTPAERTPYKLFKGPVGGVTFNTPSDDIAVFKIPVEECDLFIKFLDTLVGLLNGGADCLNNGGYP